MSFYSDEYKHLLLAERVLASCLERPDIEARDAAMVASALTRTVDQKRVMRGQPAPKPVEVERKGKGRRSFSRSTGPIDPAPNSVASSVATEPKRT